MQQLLAMITAMAVLPQPIANVMLMPHVVVNEMHGIGTLAHLGHQAHTVCSQLIQISDVLLPKHTLSKSTRCLDNGTCSLQTGIRNTADLQNSAL